jgi:large subunit ribosomal protein L4
MASIEIQNLSGGKVGMLELADEVFGAVNEDLLWEAVKHYRASQRAGTHATKNKKLVSGAGKKLWKQKGTGRARVGSVRNPLWRHGGTVFGPQPRSYEYPLSPKVERGALRAALAQKLQDGALVVVEALSAETIKTKAAVEMLKRLGVTGKAVLIDLAIDEKLGRSVRNLPGISIIASRQVTARDVMHAARVVATKDALEKLQEVLA